MKAILSDQRPFLQFLFTIFLMLILFFAVILIGFVIAIPIYNLSLSELNAYLSNLPGPENIQFFKYLQTLQAIGLFIVPAIVLPFFFGHSPGKYLMVDKRVSINNIFSIIFIMVFAIPVINFSGLINAQLSLPDWLSGLESWMQKQEASAKKLTELFLHVESTKGLAFNLFMIALLPAIGEELIFRGVLQRIFSNWTKNHHWGIIISAFLFSFMHVQFFGFLPRFLLGVLFGYMVVWSKNLWPAIIAHFINNAAAVIVYFYYNDSISKEIESFGTTKDTVAYLIVSASLLSVFLFSFYKNNKKRVAKY